MTTARYVAGSALFHMMLVLCVALPHLLRTQAMGLGDARVFDQSTSRVIYIVEVPDDAAGWMPNDSGATPVEAVSTQFIEAEVTLEHDAPSVTPEPPAARTNEDHRPTPHQLRPSSHSVSIPTTPLANTQRSTTVSQMARPDYAHNPKPDYPIALRDRGISGVVWFRVWVDAKGHPQEIEVAKGSGYRLFDEAALRAVQRWRFIPAKDAQQRLASWVEFAVRFVLSS